MILGVDLILILAVHPIQVVERWKFNKLTESEILEHLCLRLVKMNETEADGIFTKKADDYMWKKKNIIDLARMAKMNHFITNPIIQSDLNSTYLGVFQSCSQSSWPRFLSYLVSLLSLGLLAPFMLKYQKQIVSHSGFWKDMKLFPTPKYDEKLGSKPEGTSRKEQIKLSRSTSLTQSVQINRVKIPPEVETPPKMEIPPKTINWIVYNLMPYYNHLKEKFKTFYNPYLLSPLSVTDLLYSTISNLHMISAKAGSNQIYPSYSFISKKYFD